MRSTVTGRPAPAPRPAPGLIAVLVAACAGFLLVQRFLAALGFDFMNDEVTLYWNEWWPPFHETYVPLYPVMVAGARLVTLGSVAPPVLMQAVNLAWLLAGSALVYVIARSSGASRDLGVIGALLFAFWPLVGLTYAVYPLADVPAMAILLAGLYLLQRAHRWTGALVVGLSLITHKALWPFGVLMVAGHSLGETPRMRPARIAALVGMTLLPLALLWISGTAAHGSPFWILAKNVNTQVVSTGHLPVLDGAIGSFLSGGAAGIAKGALLAGVVTFAVILATLSIRQKAPEYLTGAGICASLALWWLVLNQVEIWSVARFSRLLVLPLVWVSSRHFSALPRSPGWRAAMLAGLAGLVLSQFAYAWYMAKVFYA